MRRTICIKFDEDRLRRLYDVLAGLVRSGEIKTKKGFMTLRLGIIRDCVSMTRGIITE
jgi:hypothetical protein